MATVFATISAQLRRAPWPVWALALGAAAWFARSWLLIAATVIAFHPIPIPPILQSEPRSVAEAQLQDLRHFEHVRRNERSWTAETRARFDAQVATLRQRAGQLSEADFLLGLARAQAVIDNAHSNGAVSSMVDRFPHLPIRTAFFGDELRVLRTSQAHRDLLGLRVTHIGGVDVADVLEPFRDTMGGTDANFRVIAPLLLETPAFLHAVGVAGSGMTLRFETADASSIEQTLSPVAAGDRETWVIPGDLPLAWKRDSATPVALAPARAPFYLQQEQRNYWRRTLPELGAVYINIRANLDDDTGQTLRAFASETVSTLRADPPRTIIVDLRFNHGGDYSLTHDLMASLGDVVGPDGRVYLLTSNNTFSAAIVSLAFAKRDAPGRAIIVGEEIGDRLQFWAEGWRYELPNSGFRARYATAYYDLRNGCRGLFRCYWGAFYLFPAIVDDLDVDIPAPLTFEAYAAGRDPALEAIQAAEAARGSVQ